MRRATAGAAARVGAVVLATLLAGCGSDGPIDAISSMNPFKQEEQLLPGTRRNALSNSDPTALVSGRQAIVGSPSPAGDWTQPGGTVSNDPGNLAVTSNGSRAWAVRAGRSGAGGTFGIGSGGGIRVSARPVAAGGRVFVYDPAGNVSAHVISNGGRAWQVNVRPEGESEAVNGGGIAVGDGRLFAATGFGEIVGLDLASGALAWRTALDAPARSAPTVAGGRVYTVTQAGTILAHDASTGAQVWSASSGGSGAGLLSASSPAVAGGIVVAPTSSGRIVALDAASGTEKWTATITGGSRSAALTGLQDASASPVVHDGVVYATGVGGSLIAVGLTSGEVLWTQQSGSAHTPVVSGNAVFLIDLDNRLIAFDRSTGTPFWAVGLPGGSADDRVTWAGPLLAGGRLWAVSSSGALHTVDAATGGGGQSGGVGIEGAIAPIAAGGRILLLGGEGELVGLN